MAHILDKLVAHDFGKGLMLQPFVNRLARAEMVKAENVYKYYFDTKDFVPRKDKESGEVDVIIDYAKQFPKVAPPFPVMFVGTDSFGYLGCHSAGTLFVTRPVMAPQLSFVIQDYLPEMGAKSRLDLKKQGVRWMVYAVPFRIGSHGCEPPDICAVFGVLEDGSIQHISWFGDADIITATAKRYDVEPKEVLDSRQVNSVLILWPALLAITFMHCVNVPITEHDPLATRQLRRQSERQQAKTGHPLIKFRTIDIGPIKKVLREEGQIESNGLGVALHICRGHFKDFRDGKGLFGKHKEIYWWQMQQRGSADLGTVLKDYRVSPDESVSPGT